MEIQDTGDGNIQQLIEKVFQDLSSAERRVARVMLSKYPLSGMQTIAAISRQARVSDPTVLRFVRKLGFDGHTDFQNQLKEELNMRMQGPLSVENDNGDQNSDISVYLQQFMKSLTSVVEDTFNNMSIAEIEGIVDELTNSHKKVYLLGGEFTDSVARYTYFLLRKIRPNVHLIQGQLPSRIDHLLDLGKKDVLIVFDVRRYQQDIVEFAARASKKVHSIILVTDQWLSPAATFASHVIPCRVVSQSRWDSLVGVTGVIEALMSFLSDRQWPLIKERLESLEYIREQIRTSQYADSETKSPEE